MRSKNKHRGNCTVPYRKAVGFLLLFAVFSYSCSPSAKDIKQENTADSVTLGLLSQSTGHTVLSQQTVVRFGQSKGYDSILVNGVIIPDERNTNKIAARFGGRIEKLYVRLPFQYVKKGEKLLDLYSPELNTSVSEYLFLWKMNQSSSLTIKARQKLQLLGLSDAQIEEFEKTGNVPSSVTIFSSYEGYVTSSEEVMPSGSTGTAGSTGGMSGMSQPGQDEDKNPPVPSASIREGGYISAGQTLFTINNAQRVIASLSIAGGYESSIITGMPVNISSELLPGQIINGAVDLIEPVFQNGQRFLSVRVSLSNTNGQLKYNSLIKAEIKLSAQQASTLPSSCVFDLGKRKIVWVKSAMIGNSTVFTPRVIVEGSDDGVNTQIISGLRPGEEVALDAGLLVDREGIIQTKQP